MSETTPVSIPALPFTLSPTHVAWTIDSGSRVQATAQAGTDIFTPPFPGEVGKLDAATLLGEIPEGDFQLQARITVDFRSTFDAGVLLVWHDERHWAKLCFEFAPSGEPTVVSVVNRTVSDDANAFTVQDRTIWLRVSRVDGVYLFHASVDGNRWAMVRIFALEVQGIRPRIGLEVQSPNGDGCRVVFDDIRFTRARLSDARDGS